MTGGDQVGALGFSDVGGGASLVAGAQVVGPLEIEARVATSTFPAELQAGGLLELGVGARLAFTAPREWLVWGPAAHVHLAFTGSLLLPSIDLSLRAGVVLGRGFSLGPEFAYGQVFWKNAPGYSTDAHFVSLGLSLAWRLEPPPSPPPPAPERRRPPVIVRRPDPPREVTPDVDIDRLLDDALPATRREEYTLIPPVLFVFDSTEMLPCGEVALFAALDAIAATTDRVTIEGHADGTGTDAYNADLSLRRAEAVRAWLVAHGIPPDRLRLSAYGSARPLTQEVDESARQIDRRVTFQVVRTTVSSTPFGRPSDSDEAPSGSDEAPSDSDEAPSEWEPVE